MLPDQASPPAPTAHPTKVRRGASGPLALGLTAFAFVATMVGTTLPTALYQGYEQRFGFGAFTVTVVFAAYAVGVLAALIGVGRASDDIGRRPMLFAGLAAAALSSGIFLLAGALHSGGLPLLLIARVLSGLSAGVFTGTATAAIADFAGTRHPQLASILAAVSTTVGLGLGPLVSGVLARHVGLPLQTSYLVHLGLIALAAAVVALLAETVRVQPGARPRMRKLLVPREIRTVFVRAGVVGFAGFAVFGLFTSVSPSFLALLGHHDPQLTGLVVFVVFAISAAAQALSAFVGPVVSYRVGTALLVAGMVIFGLSVHESSLPLLIAGGLVAGAGQGLSFRAALGTVTGASPPHQRAGVASSFFATCYVGISLPVIGVGAATQAYGLKHTGEVFAAVVAVLALGALLTVRSD